MGTSSLASVNHDSPLGAGSVLTSLKPMAMGLLSTICILLAKKEEMGRGRTWGVGNCCRVGNNSREGLGNTFQYSLLENPMDRGAWRATDHRVAESWTQLKQLSMHARMHACTHPTAGSLQEIWSKSQPIHSYFRWVIHSFSANISHCFWLQQSPLIHSFAFSSFSYPQSTTVQKYNMKYSRNKQFRSFKKHSVLIIMIKFHAISLLPHPAPDVNHLFVWSVSPVGHLAAILVIRSTVRVLQCSCSTNPYFT